MKSTKIPKGAYQGGDLVNPSETGAADRHMLRSSYPADELLVNAFSSVWGLLQRGSSTTGRKIFRSSDCQAHQHGWQIIPGHGGFSRTYRDPRFDHLAACMTCNGRGRDPSDITCSDCQGTGRVFLALDVTSKQRRGQP